jgi:TRAP-type mannitol/chloroaromatic compound transport system permease small subunit
MKNTDVLRKVVKVCDSVSEWSGKAVSWLLIALIISLVYEVISRHFFNSPTFWAYDISYMLGGTVAFIGGAMALKNKQHVRVDLFYAKLSPRKQAVVDIVLSVLLFFPLLIYGFTNSFAAALLSWERKERIMSGFWQPPIYPLKMIISIAFALLIVQGVGELIRNVLKLLYGREV